MTFSSLSSSASSRFFFKFFLVAGPFVALIVLVNALFHHSLNHLTTFFKPSYII